MTISHSPLLDQFSKVITVAMFPHSWALDTTTVPMVQQSPHSPNPLSNGQTSPNKPFSPLHSSWFPHGAQNCPHIPASTIFFFGFLPHLEGQASLSVSPAFRFFPFKAFLNDFKSLLNDNKTLWALSKN